jgi:hypothetical protein
MKIRIVKQSPSRSLTQFRLLLFETVAFTVSLYGAPAISNVVSPSQIGKYQKFEISFDISNTVAQNLQLPYDPAPPNGIDFNYPMHKGISVDAQFTPDNWQTVYRQPAFFYYYYQDGGNKSSWDGHMHAWYYPTGQTGWKVRFSPNQVGTWQFKLSAADAGGSAMSGVYSFIVNASSKKGFVRVSPKDPRYFEFDDGTLFSSPGLQAGGDLADPPNNASVFTEFQKDHISLLRNWISGLYGAAWPQWLGGRNIYDGYLPRPGLLPFHDSVRNRDVMAMYITYPEGWYDACQFEFWEDSEAVKPNTTYKLSIEYWGENIAGPRVTGSSQYGLVGKISANSSPNCYEPGTGTVITTYGGNTSDWATIEGTWFSGNTNFLPKVYLGLENVTQGKAHVLSISMKEVLGNGQYGPEIMQEPLMEYELYFPDLFMYAMDKYVELAEQYDMYLKLVLMEKNDYIYYKLDDDGTFVINGEPDNLDGFYGLGRTMNKTRWLQRTWWRYLQARWGYSPNIHTWELTNEGDPFLTTHWQMTDELGKFMHCGAFGVSVGTGDSAPCTFQHPNRHLVTTSFWTGFPGYDPATGNGFWGNPKYPNVDYADVHAYITTSPAPDANRILMQWDAAYYHLWHSQTYGGWKFKFPIVRGEAGMTPYNTNTDDWGGLGLQNDTQGIWYHNFLWSSLDSGALYENYWYYDPHVLNKGVYDHRPEALPLFNFTTGIPLSNGSYQDSAPVVSNSNLRVVGQKDLTSGNAHLWIQNKNHTWKNVVDGVTITPISGTVRISGFAPGKSYTLEWWDTYKTIGQVSSTQSVTSASDGSLTISVQSLISDMGLKIIGSAGSGDPIAPAAPKNFQIQLGP